MKHHKLNVKPFTILVLTLAFSLAFLAGAAMAQDPDEFSDFSELSMEELLGVTVVSSSKVEQSIFEAPNSIHVITAEDIDHAGARNIPEALRLAPGVYVAQINGNEYTVTIGGFALGVHSNKILVLIDGVSVYNSKDGWVEWSTLPVTIDEVERIEVIRGPGGVTYGANAVNGVVNIITRSPDRKTKNYVNARVGTQDTRMGNAGMTVASDGGEVTSRLAIGYEEDNGTGMKDGDKNKDQRNDYTVSSRTNFHLDESTVFSIDGRYRRGEYHSPYLGPSQQGINRAIEDGIARVRLDQKIGGGEWYLQGFHRRKIVQNYDVGVGFVPSGSSSVTDVEIQTVTPYEALGNNKLILGGGYRWSEEEHERIVDGEQNYTVANVYLQNEWKPTDQLIFNSGVKWEDVDYIDPTWQWRGALNYLPTPEHGFRISAANAYRSPALSEYYNDLVVGIPPGFPPLPPGSPTFIVAVLGNDELEPEQVLSYETGYRGLWFERMMFDVSYAYRTYDNLISLYEAQAGVPPFGLGEVFTWGDDGEAVTQTVEVSVDYRVTDELRILAVYTWLDVDVSGDNVYEDYEHNNSENYGRAGLAYNAKNGFIFDFSGRYADVVYVQQIDDPTREPTRIDAYWALDARIAQAFKMNNGAELEIGAVGQNLGQEWHEEYIDYTSFVEPLEIRRGYYGYVEYRTK